MKVKVRQELIRKLRINRGWTQEKLADVSNVHTRTIQRIENDGEASVQSLNALATALEFDPENLKQLEAETDQNSTAGNYPHSIVSLDSSHSSMPRYTLFRRTQYSAKKVQKSKDGERQFFEWVAWAILFIGGYLTVNVLLITQANLSRAVIFDVFFPGIAIGILFMTLGGIGIQLAQKAKHQYQTPMLLQPAWAAWITLFMVGLLIVTGLLISAADLGRSEAIYVLLPTTAIGLPFMIIAMFKLQLSKRAREEETNKRAHDPRIGGRMLKL